MGVETLSVDAWLTFMFLNDSVLKGLGLKGAYSEKVPTQALVPYILWSDQGPTDNVTQEGFRVNVQCLFLVRVVNQTRDWEDVIPFADRIDALLEHVQGNALGRVIQQCVREAPYRLVEDQGEGIEWRHLGGRYRMYVSSP